MTKSLKYIKNRIRSIENTKKVTNALQLISLTKLNSMDDVLYAARNYFLKLESVFNDFTAVVGAISSPLFEERPDKKKICLCLITSDSGLCGMYNNNIVRRAEEFINSVGREKIELVAVGRRGFNHFKSRGVRITNTYLGLNGRYSAKVAEDITNNLLDSFLSGASDEVHIAYTHFETALICKPVIKKFLNIKIQEKPQAKYLLEPDRQRIMEEWLPRYISMSLRTILLESFTSEHAARTIAMKTATENAKELLDALVLMRNKVRQAIITQDMMEIISSSEALKA